MPLPKNLVRSVGHHLNRVCLLLVIGWSGAFSVTPGFAQENVRVPATVYAYESAEIYAKIGGYLKSVAVDIGDTVQAGQTLAVIDVPEMTQRLAQKNSLLALAEAKAKQATARIEEAKAKLVALEAGIKEAETMKAQKQALYDFERIECERISRLVASGAVQTELLNAAQYKLQAADAARQAVAAQVATAQAQLVGGRAAVRRASADADAARAQIAVAQADVNYLQKMLEYATVAAPWNGKVASRNVDAGAFVQNADGNSGAKPLFKLIRDDKIRVRFALSQKYLEQLAIGVPVTLSDIGALPGQSFKGKVSRFSAELDPATRMMRVEMDLDNSDGKLKPGFFGYATLHFKK